MGQFVHTRGRDKKGRPRSQEEVKVIKGAIFDMDGLMFDTERVYRCSWITALEKRGLTAQEGFLQDIVGTRGQKILDVISSYYPSIEPQTYYQEVVRMVREETGANLPEKQGIHEILEYFKEKGIPVAVASSSPPELIRRNLVNAGMEELVDFWISGKNVAHGKPEPDIFLASADALGLKPEECYVFEDGINGVLAGLAAGCRTIMVPDVQKPTQEILDRGVPVYESLVEVLEAIKKGEGLSH